MITRKRLGWIALILVGLVCMGGGGLYWASSQVPDFYRQAMAAQVDPETRQAEAKLLTQRTLQMVDDIKHRDHWAEEFTQLQINSWFIVELDGRFEDLLPEGAKDPRVVIKDGSIHFGLKYAYEGWAGVVSFRVKPWVPEPNHLALEIESIKAGLIPIPLDRVFQDIEREFETRGWKVTWRQANGHDVMVIDFGQRKKDKSVLESIKVFDGRIQVSGKGEGKGKPKPKP